MNMEVQWGHGTFLDPELLLLLLVALVELLELGPASVKLLSAAAISSSS